MISLATTVHRTYIVNVIQLILFGHKYLRLFSINVALQKTNSCLDFQKIYSFCFCYERIHLQEIFIERRRLKT
jgi:hypothetical protein